MEDGASTASAAPAYGHVLDPSFYALEPQRCLFLDDSSLGIAPSPSGQKRARGDQGNDAPRRAWFDFLGVADDEKEAFLEKLKAAISEGEALPGSSFFGAKAGASKADKKVDTTLRLGPGATAGASMADQEVDMTLRLGMGSLFAAPRAAALGDDGGREEHGESLSAFLGAVLDALGDDQLKPPEFEEDALPPRVVDFASPEDEALLALLEDATDPFDVRHPAHAAPADGETAPSSGFDLNQPYYASPADDEELPVPAGDDDQLPAFKRPFIVFPGEEPDPAPDDGTEAADIDEPPILGTTVRSITTSNARCRSAGVHGSW